MFRRAGVKAAYKRASVCVRACVWVCLCMVWPISLERRAGPAW